jgi:hypothetical protein
MRRAPTAAAFVLALIVPLGARGEASPGGPLATLQQIRTTFLAGEYGEVVDLAGQLLETDPSMLVRTEALQYFGASLELLGRTEEAEEQFEVLLTLQPLFHMNQADFPTEVVSLFESVRLRVQDRLDQIEGQRRRARDAERRERERRLLEQQQRLVEAARPRYLVRETRERHLVVAFLPFGAGQFQNGDRGRGWAFLGAQAGLTVASMLVWLLGTVATPTADDDFLGFQIASYSTYATLGVAVVWGIIDALAGYRRVGRRNDEWREVRARDVPASQRLEVSPELLRLDETLGAGAGEQRPGNDGGANEQRPAP